jgi:DNA-binding NarL/FixJ family response regulator
MKQEAVSSVVKAIREIRKGNIYASDKIKEKIFKRLISPHSSKEESPLSGLTARELEVFRLIGMGFSSKEISEQLHLSIKTIGTYRENIKAKLQIKHYAELIKAAVHWLQQIEL